MNEIQIIFSESGWDRHLLEIQDNADAAWMDGFRRGMDWQKSNETPAHP